MGCCENVQTPEEENILSFFNKKLKENGLYFSIKNYQDNYDKILKFSGNIFKRLSKKQNVRLNFIKKLREKETLFINNNKPKIEDVQKILYQIMLLTILLDTKKEEVINTEEIHNDINQINLNNLKRELLEHGYNLFSMEFDDINNSKKVKYYLTKLFILCFQDFPDVNNYISLAVYIEQIKSVLDLANFTDEEERYIFVKDSVLTLGEYFNYNNYVSFDEKINEIIIDLIVIVMNYWNDYFVSNITGIKDSINKNVRNATDKLINYEEFNDNIETKLNNDNINFEDFNSDNINDDIFQKDIKLILESLYYIFNKIIQDIYMGKNIIINLGNKLISKNDNKYQFNKIIIFILFYECYIKSNEKLILCFLEYITDLYITNDQLILTDDEIFYDIVLNSYYLLYKNEQLNKQYISLVTQIFIKEMGKEENKSQLLINQLIQIYQKKEKTNKINKIFFYLIFNVGIYYNNLINSNYDKENSIVNIINNEFNKNKIIIKNILLNLNEIIKAYFMNNINGFTPSIKEKGVVVLNTNNINNLSTNNVTYNVYNNENYINNLKISINNYEKIIANFFNFNNLKNEILENIEFYLYFHIFIINNMNILPLINDLTQREKIYNNFFRIITHIEILSIQDSIQKKNNFINEYVNDIISSLQIILKINELNSPNNYIQDCFLFYKSLAKNIKTLIDLDISKNIKSAKIVSINLKIIYSIIFFILCQFINLINIPNSISQLNDQIIATIKQFNEKCANLFSKINISNFIIYNNTSDNQNYFYLKELFSKENDENFSIEQDMFKQILDVVNVKLFGINSSLNIFFDNQIPNSNYIDNMNNSLNKTLNKLSDNITVVNDNSIINQYKDDSKENNIEDISIHIFDSKKKSINDINTLIKKDSTINFPSDNDNIISNNKIISNSFTNEDIQYQNIKV
jgi:hypothetical protein